MGRNRKKISTAELLMWIGILIIFLAAALLVSSRIKELRLQEQEAIQKEQQLQKEYDAEKERTGKLIEEKKRVDTDEYVEEVARDRLGLIYPGEVQFKEEGK